MENLIEMQKHIDALRGSLEIERGNNEHLSYQLTRCAKAKQLIINEAKKLSDQKLDAELEAFDNDQRAFELKVWLFAASFVAGCSLILNAMLYDANDQLEESAKLEQSKTADAEQRVKNCIEFIKIQDEEMQELRKANGAMIKHGCDKNINKAIKATPLPKLVEA